MTTESAAAVNSYTHGTGTTPLLGDTIGANLDRAIAAFPDREALVDVRKVGDVQVVGVPDEKYGEEILACVIPRDPADPPALEDIVSYCRERLAHYKIPRRVEIVAEFPMTVSGKVRKIELRERFSGPSGA
ncbi:hypothetical protein ACFXKX_28895 [Streptomyces scopuliridis]|uniref:AMP-binding enzyme n=1 Tax=Streptomyces scopuliridis TaxID=452529 RepID=UPI003676C760